MVIVSFSEVTLLILRKMAQQFCCQLEEGRLKQINLEAVTIDLFLLKKIIKWNILDCESNILSKIHRLCRVELVSFTYLCIISYE